MNVAVIGSGGREHALAYKLSQSKLLNNIFVIPGNPGTKSIATNIAIELDDFENILKFCNENKIELVIIGPEMPLVKGLADYLRENNVNVFGPNKNAAIIEGDKSFSKSLMRKYEIPTAEYEIFNSKQIDEALHYLKTSTYPIVIKASGLAAGKGVSICKDYLQAENAINLCFTDKKFGESGDKIVIEEFLEGSEVSIFAITDGTDFVLLPPSQDHKQIFNGDKGENTGGMGAYSPVSVDKLFHNIVANRKTDLNDEIPNTSIMTEIEEKIVKKTLSAMKTEGIEFNGCLYCGLMITETGPKVIEYNCRFGDPEIQAVLRTIDGDFLELLNSAAKGKVNKNSVHYNGGASVCVVAASDGYPNKYRKGFEISGLENIDNPDVIVFHAGTKESDGKILTDGGRVLSVSSFYNKNDISKAKSMSYEALSKIKFEGMYFRTDISDKAL